MALKTKNKEQDKLLDDYKEKEITYKDKIYQLEKQLRETQHALELSKIDHDREIQLLNSKLEKKDEQLDKQLEEFVMNKLDLDEFNITSDDFRNSEESKGSKVRSRNKQIEKRLQNRQNKTYAHPKVPKLDFTKIFEWRERSNNDNVIMIKISESRITGEDRIIEEINDDDGIQKRNKKYFGKGIVGDETSTRVNDMHDRKQMIINALNSAYADEDEGDSESQN